MSLPVSRADREQQGPMGASPVGRSNWPCLPAVYRVGIEGALTMLSRVWRGQESTYKPAVLEMRVRRKEEDLRVAIY